MRRARLALIALELFAALNAVGGGVYALGGAEGVSREWLEGTPFEDYTIPGILLLVGAGVMLAAAGTLVARLPSAPAVSVAAGGLLVAWIVVQVALIGYVSWMQPASFAAGLVIVALGLALTRSEDRALHPAPQTNR